jgi:hypothetical protein
LIPTVPLAEYPAVRYYPPTGDLDFDVLTRLGEAASFETVDAEIKDIRLQDQADAAALRERFNLKNEE